jgi:SAM-dependent MidA family methyltransferase
MESPLQRWIATHLEANGPVPFARFMEWCLYHPEHGYYSAGRVQVGSDAGDFTTAPHVSAVFARCLARFVDRVDRALGRPDGFVIIEGGPGEGRLARDLLDTLAERHPHLYSRLRYHLDEASPALRTRQRRLLGPHAARVEHGMPGHRAPGLYISNELLDAMPVHRLRNAEGELLEVWVESVEGALGEILLPPESAAVATSARVLAQDGGWMVEVRPGVDGWLARAAGALERGAVVTVDYGDTAPRLFGPHHPDGTCVAYRDHRQHRNLLAVPGEQDLTAQVDFSALVAAGEALGLAHAPLCKQREFLFANGLLEELEAMEAAEGTDLEKLQLRQALAPLLMPGAGMGDAFKVLVQRKNCKF